MKDIFFFLKKEKKFNFPILIISFFPIIFFLGSGVINFFIILLDLIFLIEIIKNKRLFILKNIFFYLLIVFWAILIINLYFSIDYQNSLGRSLGFIRFIILVFAFQYYLNYMKCKYQNIVFKTWCLTFFIISVDLIYEFSFGKNIFGYSSYMPGRLSGFFNDELKIGYLYSSLILFSLSYLFIFFFKERKNIIKKNSFFDNKNIFYFLIFFSLFVSFIIGERSNFLKALIIVFFFIFLVDQKYIYRKIIILFSFFLILFLIILNSDSYKYRFWTMLIKPGIEKPVSFVKNSNYGQHYMVAIEVFKNNKIYGVGLKNYREEVKKDIYNKNSSIHPHQVHFEILAELGLIGYFYFLIFFVFSLFFSINSFFKEKNIYKLSAILFVFVNLLPIIPTGSFFTTYTATIFWINFAIMLPKNRLLNKL